MSPQEARVSEPVPLLSQTDENFDSGSSVADDPIADLERNPRPDVARSMRLFRDHGFHKGDWVMNDRAKWP